MVADKEEEAEATTRTLVARFNLVDLAGSERQVETKTEGARLKEASGINKSLSNLVRGQERKLVALVRKDGHQKPPVLIFRLLCVPLAGPAF